ncbi:MAG: hypothetical protein J6T57_02005 [Alphaproteobacteria bacterium]|nr:hypothetical protein [Alphaproteobacteria bacterium]
MNEPQDISTFTYYPTNTDLLNQLGHAEAEVIGAYYTGILKDLTSLQKLAKDKTKIEQQIYHLTTGLDALAKIGDRKLNIKWLGKYEKGGSIRTQSPSHQKFKTMLQSGITDNPEYELATHQIATLAFYAGLCSLQTYLGRFKPVFKKEENEAMRLLSAQTQNMRKELPNYLSQKPNNSLEIEEMNEKFDKILYKTSSDNYGNFLQSYFQYDGDIFSDLYYLRNDSVRAFNSIYGYDNFTYNGLVETIDNIINLGEGNVVTPPLDLYLSCVQTFLKHRLNQPDMQNVEQDKQNTILLFGEMRNLSYNSLLNKAAEYLAKRK